MLTRNASAPTSLDTDALFAGLRDARGLLLAVSGGPDSTALLILVDCWRKTSSVPVFVATVDHRLRPESRAEAQAVAAVCAVRDLAHHILPLPGTPPATRIQERARQVRYRLLADCAKTVGADTIVTAHHADDQAETILMRLLRGSGPSGLAGMAPRSCRDSLILARPLLDVPKQALIDLCRTEGVPFANDPSNDDIALRRPQVRVLATLLAAEGLDRRALARLGRRAARSEDAIAWALRRACTQVLLDDGHDGVRLSAAQVLKLPEELALRVMHAQIARLSPGPVRLAHAEALVERMRQAIAADQPFAATLGNALVRFRSGLVTVTRAPPRRHVAYDDGYPSSPTCLGKGDTDP